jgi:hypothetical protein
MTMKNLVATILTTLLCLSTFANSMDRIDGVYYTTSSYRYNNVKKDWTKIQEDRKRFIINTQSGKINVDGEWFNILKMKSKNNKTIGGTDYRITLVNDNGDMFLALLTVIPSALPDEKSEVQFYMANNKIDISYDLDR